MTKHSLPPLLRVLVAAALVGVSPALAQTVTENPDGSTTIQPDEEQKPPGYGSGAEITLNYVDTPIWDLLIEFAQRKRMNFVIGDPKELQSKKVTLIGHHPVSINTAYEAFLAAMEVSGFTLSRAGDTYKVVKLSEAAQHPGIIGKGGSIRASDQVITQLIQLENTRVDDISKIITTMAPSDAKIIAYPPTNTMIITDTANNIRKLYKVMQTLDVEAPKSTLEIVPIQFADVNEVKALIEELYGTEETSDTKTPARPTRRRSSRDKTPVSTDPVSAGSESKYISKVLADERTSSLVVLANSDGHAAVANLVAEVDIDVDPQNRAQIHVVYLEHAKAEEVANVLSQLSEEGNTPPRNNTPRATTAKARAAAAAAAKKDSDDGDGKSGAIAAFDSGMRIAADENTNSLVIIANLEDFKVVETVIDKLDIERKQVFVDAVIMELSSEDSGNFGIATHAPQSPAEGSVGFLGAQLGASSLGLSQDALSGLAFGVYGESIDVPIIDPTTGTSTTLPIPAFGIALNAIKTSGSTNIISNPNLTTLDNEEAKIVVGRKIPFPSSTTVNQVGQAIQSFQREDVAITLQMTPRINSGNFVTLELQIEVQEVEDSAEGQGAAVQQGGFITSKRELETVALIKDNQTMVIGGLVGTTDVDTEGKVPILGDIPVIGALFRSSVSRERKTNLMIFLTPHIIDDENDMYEIQRVKEAQRREFLRRFYGKSRDQYMAELQELLKYSMNFIDEPSQYPGASTIDQDVRLDGEPITDETRDAINDALEDSRTSAPGEDAGTLDEEGGIRVEPAPAPAPTEGGE